MSGLSLYSYCSWNQWQILYCFQWFKSQEEQTQMIFFLFHNESLILLRREWYSELQKQCIYGKKVSKGCVGLVLFLKSISNI